jgi:tetratricopeptide (TPR) repeat protein
LLAALVDALAGAAMLLLATCRPGYRAPWLDKSYATQMALQPLSPDESRQVVRRVMRATVIPPALEQQLLARAEGNPFFLEELTYSVQEQGEGDTTLTVPDTIHAVLAGRMDRLSPPERQLLQAAAVIGKDVAVPLLQTITERPEAALQQELTQLQAAEFLYQARFFPERAYTFKHALTQEVAYGSLLPERRRALHARLVAAIEHLTEDRGDEPIERLARHALQGEVWDKALTYCWQAGEKAMAGSAHREAVGSFEQALSVLPHLPETHDTLEQAVDLRLALRSALRPLGDFGRILTCLREAERLAEALDDRRRLSQVLRYLSSYFYLMDAYDQAIVAAQRALALATTGEEAVLPALANQYLGLTHQARGDYGQAIDCYRQTVALLEGPWRHERCGEAFLPAVFARAALAVCHANLGMFAAGETLGAEGLRIAEAVDNPASLMWAYWGVGLLALRQGDPHKALPWLKRAVRICQDADLPAWFPRMAVALGQAYTLVGRLSDAVPLLAQALELSMARERAQFQILARLSLGETHMLAGRLEEARPLAEGALTLTRARQERSHQAEALRLLGDIAARREPPEPDQAEAFYREALTLADELGLRPLVAHCHRSLGLLHRDTGRLAEAHSELSAAITLYRDMDMTFWLPQTEDALAHL